MDKEYYETGLKDGSQTTFIVSMDDEDIGAGTISYMKELPSPDNVSGKIAWISYVFIKQKFRRNGAGGALVERMAMEARMKGCGKIWLDGLIAGISKKNFMGFQSRPGILELP